MKFKILTAALLIAACATDQAGETETAETSPEADPRVGEEVDQVCFLGSISGFSEYDEGQGIILRRTANERYLAKILGICPAADFPLRVGLVPRSAGGTCLTRGDELLVSENLIPTSQPFDTEICRVGKIYEWNGEAAEDEEVVDTDDA